MRRAREKMWVNISGGIDCTRGVIVVKGQDQRNGDLAEVETASVALARPKLEKSPGETSALPVRNPAV